MAFFGNYFSIFQSKGAGEDYGLVENSTLERLTSLGFQQEDAQFLLKQGYDLKGIQARLDQKFTPAEIVNAVKVKNLHDRVEISAYGALQEGIEQLKLVKGEGKTRISAENSIYFLHFCVRKAAHKDMRSSDGYVSRRGDFLNKKQFLPVITRVGDIVSDRDAKLTKATYNTLEDVIENLDAHNTFVNAILFNAWGVPEREGYDHLAEIKKAAGLVW